LGAHRKIRCGKIELAVRKVPILDGGGEKFREVNKRQFSVRMAAEIDSP